MLEIPSVATMQVVTNAPELIRLRCCNRIAYFPLFTLTIVVAQVSCFYGIAPSSSNILGLLVPCPPGEWYRILSNMFAHADNYHLWVNVGSSIVLGLFLELRNGFVRITPIWYLSAVLGTAFEAIITTRRPIRISGSSGGVYGLLAALVAELVMNWAEIRFRWVLALSFVLVFSLEIALVASDPQPNIAYGAHFFGALQGFSVGLCLVKNWRWRRFEYAIFFAALSFTIVSFATIVALLPRIFV